jgi:hypothetical protein
MLDWKPVKKVKNKYGQPRSFLPGGKSQQVIYVVTLRDQPGIVKVGRTAKWHLRRKAYSHWNLANGTGIDRERLFCITEEFVDLAKLEREILFRMPFEIVHGTEWFRAEIDEACRLIDAILLEHEITYV